MASQTRSVDNTVSSQWADPDNAFTENDLCTSTSGDGNQNVYNITGTPFTIPGGSTITGIEVKVIRGGDADDYYSIELQDNIPAWKLKNGSALLAVCAAGVQETLGGPSDVWAGTWDPAHINSSSFQIRLTFNKSGKANTETVDHIEVVVYYAEAVEKTITADAVLVTRTTKEITSDAVLKQTSIKTVTVDAVVAEIWYCTLNGTIEATEENCDERGFDWDYDSGEPYEHSLTESGSYGTGSFGLQLAALIKGNTVYFRAKAHNAGGWGYGSERSVTAADTQEVTATADAVLKALATPITATLDAILVDRLSVIATLDAVLAEGVAPVTIETAVDAILIDRLSIYATTDAVLKALGLTIETDTDAVLVNRLAALTTSDAVLVDRLTVSMTGDGVLVDRQVIQATADAVVVDRLEVTATSDAVLVTFGFGLVVATMDAVLRKTSTVAVTVDATLVSQQFVTSQMDAVLSLEVEKPTVWPPQPWVRPKPEPVTIEAGIKSLIGVAVEESYRFDHIVYLFARLRARIQSAIQVQRSLVAMATHVVAVSRSIEAHAALHIVSHFTLDLRARLDNVEAILTELDLDGLELRAGTLVKINKLRRLKEKLGAAQ